MEEKKRYIGLGPLDIEAYDRFIKFALARFGSKENFDAYIKFQAERIRDAFNDPSNCDKSLSEIMGNIAPSDRVAIVSELQKNPPDLLK